MGPVTDLLPDLALGLLGGAVLAALHLALLWHGLRRLKAPGGAMLAGALIRLGLTGAGIAALAWIADHPEVTLVAALIGFAAVRRLVLPRVAAREG